MSETRVKVVHNGQLVDAVDVPIGSSTEGWNEYQLGDGTKLRVKYVLASIARIEGTYDPDRNPLYALKGNVIAVPVVPDHLRQKG